MEPENIFVVTTQLNLTNDRMSASVIVNHGSLTVDPLAPHPGIHAISLEQIVGEYSGGFLDRVSKNMVAVAQGVRIAEKILTDQETPAVQPVTVEINGQPVTMVPTEMKGQDQ